MPLTPEQLTVLRHSLGLNPDGTGRSYRNHYVAGPGHYRYQELTELIALGHMRRRATPSKILPEGDECFHVTELGEQAAAAPEAKLSRGKRRWQAYRSVKDACPELSFLRFLQDPEFALYR